MFDGGGITVSSSSVCDEPKGITVRIREDSDQLYFVYSGGNRGMMINPAVLLYESGLFERNLLLAHDRWNAYYQCGVSRDLARSTPFSNGSERCACHCPTSSACSVLEPAGAGMRRSPSVICSGSKKSGRSAQSLS